MRITVILNECEGSRAFIFKFKYILEVRFSGDLGHILGRLKHKREKKCNKCIKGGKRFSDTLKKTDCGAECEK